MIIFSPTRWVCWWNSIISTKLIVVKMGILPKEGGEHQKELKQPSLKWINNHQSHQRNQSKFNTKHGGGNTMTTIISIPLKERCWSKQQRQNQGHPSTTHTKTNHTATWAFKATNHPHPRLKRFNVQLQQTIMIFKSGLSSSIPSELFVVFQRWCRRLVGYQCGSKVLVAWNHHQGTSG